MTRRRQSDEVSGTPATTATSGSTSPSSTASGRWTAAARVAAAAAVVAAALVWPPSRWIAATLLGLVVLIAAHEYGHLWAARRVGLGASEFSVGLGPALVSVGPNRHGTVFRLRPIPLGGFVKLAGLDVTDIDRTLTGGSWQQLSAPRRAAVSAAGPAANVLLAWLCLLVLFAAGGRQVPTTEVTPLSGSSAAAAGVEAGDVVVAVDDVDVISGEHLARVLASSDGSVMLTVDRDGDLVDVGPVAVVGSRIGVRLSADTVKLTSAEALNASAEGTLRLGTATVGQMGSLAEAMLSLPSQLTGDADSDDPRVMSPLGTARVAEDVADSSGVFGMLMLVAVVSMFLAVFNLLPIPPLDGGHLLVATVEGVGSKVSGRQVTVPAHLLAKATSAVIAAVVVLGLSALLLDLLRPVA